jgi:hypothetical protein
LVFSANLFMTAHGGYALTAKEADRTSGNRYRSSNLGVWRACREEYRRRIPGGISLMMMLSPASVLRVLMLRGAAERV